MKEYKINCSEFIEPREEVNLVGRLKKAGFDLTKPLTRVENIITDEITYTQED